MKALLLVSASVLFIGCGSSENSGLNIVGGSAATLEDTVTKHTVSLTLSSGGDVTINNTSFCTGAILAIDKVVTASSCFRSDITDLLDRGAVLSVVFGLNGNNLQVSRQVSAFKLHPQFDASLIAVANPTKPANDVALLTFSGGLPQGYQAVSVVSENTAIVPNSKIVIAGFGVPNRATGNTGVLRKAQVNFAATLTAANVVHFRSVESAPCDGDSGAPAFFERNNVTYLLGVTSSSNCKTFMRYTDLRKYSSFIAGN